VTHSSELQNISDLLTRGADRFGDRDFLVIGRRREVISFRSLAEASERFARVLRRLGAKPGDRIALSMTNRVSWAVAAFGTARCGCVLVAVSTRLQPREITHMIALTRARFWLLEDVFLGKIEAHSFIAPVMEELRDRAIVLPLVMVLSDTGERYSGACDWREELEATDPSLPLQPVADLATQSVLSGNGELDGVAAILSTSGTTGAPKGVMLGHTNLIRLAAAVAHRQCLSPDERFYSIGPFFHCSGYMHGLLANLLAGSTYFTTAQFDVEESWDVLTNERVTVYHGFIEVLRQVSVLPQFDRSALASFDRAWYSAPAAEMADLESKLGVKMCEVYGLTETGGNVAITTAEDPVDMRHDSDGRPHDGLEVIIADPQDGTMLPEGTQGEIKVRGFNVMLGYFDDRAATDEVLDPDGWLSTGDQGVMLPGGFLKFTSRLKDVIRVGGENLSPLEVEEVLIGHPAISEVAVVAAPHERLVEIPVAFVVLAAGAPLAEDELREYCSERLAKFKVPSCFIVVEEFPRTAATNRVQKARLREMLATATQFRAIGAE